jgi:hypothetical protein
MVIERTRFHRVVFNEWGTSRPCLFPPMAAKSKPPAVRVVVDFERKIKMDFERYYLDLFEMLNSCCKKIASGKYDKSDSERLFELSKKGRYPAILAELAESFGMMLVKVEAREFEKSQMIEELEETKTKLEDYSKKLEGLIEEYCPEQSPTD